MLQVIETLSNCLNPVIVSKSSVIPCATMVNEVMFVRSVLFVIETLLKCITLSSRTRMLQLVNVTFLTACASDSVVKFTAMPDTEAGPWHVNVHAEVVISAR